MKKWLITILILLAACTASASLHGSLITFQPIEAGWPGSFENPLKPSDFIDIYITVDNYFFAMDVMVGITGPAQIIDVTGIDEAEEFGWSALASNDPLIIGNLVELGLAVIFDAKPAGLAAKITLQATGQGQVIFDIGNGDAFEKSTDGYFRTPVVMGELTIYQTHAPEPATVLLLALGVFPAIIKRKRA